MVSPAKNSFLNDRPTRTGHIAFNEPGWFILNRLRDELRQIVADNVKDVPAQLVDYGCAQMPYRDLFPKELTYLGADLAGNPDSDLTITDGYAIPLETATTDYVLSTQVLEHVFDPHAYLSECRRVLRPDGRLILSTHGHWVYHQDPEDYWRWTSPGLTAALDKAGFSVHTIKGVGGLSTVALQYIQDLIARRLPPFLRPCVWIVLQRLAAVADRMHSDVSRLNDSMVYLVVAKPKPA